LKTIQCAREQQVSLINVLMYAAVFFIFFIFYFCFLQKYIFDLEIYRNIPGRSAAGRQELICKKIQQKIADRSLGTGRPAAGRPALFFAI
jgi:hypothetical protein